MLQPAKHDGPRYSLLTLGTGLMGVLAAMFGVMLIFMTVSVAQAQREARRATLIEAEVVGAKHTPKTESAGARYSILLRFENPEGETLEGSKPIRRSAWLAFERASEENPLPAQVVYHSPRKWDELHQSRATLGGARVARNVLLVVVLLLASGSALCFVLARKRRPDRPETDMRGWRDVPEGYALSKWQMFFVAYHPALASAVWMLKRPAGTTASPSALKHDLVNRVQASGELPLRYFAGGMLMYHITPHFRLLHSWLQFALLGVALIVGSLILMVFVAIGRAVVTLPPDTEGAEMFSAFFGVLGVLAAIGATVATVFGIMAYKRFKLLAHEPFWSDTPVFAFWPFEWRLPPLRSRGVTPSGGPSSPDAP